MQRDGHFPNNLMCGILNYFLGQRKTVAALRATTQLLVNIGWTQIWTSFFFHQAACRFADAFGRNLVTVTNNHSKATGKKGE